VEVQFLQIKELNFMVGFLPMSIIGLKEEMMKEGFRELWVDALESGDYLQGTGCLTSVSKDNSLEYNCCTGVAIKLAIDLGCELKIGKKCREAALNHSEWLQHVITYNECSDYLPLAVIKFLELEHPLLDIWGKYHTVFYTISEDLAKELNINKTGRLDYLNDFGKDFKLIAKVIRGAETLRGYGMER